MNIADLSKSFKPINSQDPHRVTFFDDGFAVTAAEPWIITKVNIIQQYLTAFVCHPHRTGWDDIVVVDLYSGNGLYSLGAKRELFPGTALTSLGLDLPVNKFCLLRKGARTIQNPED